VKQAKLTLTPHHLFYLLSRFQELGVTVGPMDIRLENIHTEASPANYVSFLNQAQRNRIRSSDRDSIHSVSSIRSVMSSMSSLWTKLGLHAKSEAKLERQKAAEQDDLRYLYSAFTKVPCLRLSPDHKAPLIAGYEEFPFDSAVPLLAFKNVTYLEICHVDFRQFYGWDRMADQLRSLTLKNAHIEDPTDLLVNIVLDDMDKRRRRSAKVPPSPILPWSAPSPVLKQGELVRTASDASPPVRPMSVGSSTVLMYPSTKGHRRQRSASPERPTSSRHGSSQGHSRSGTPILRRSSASSTSTDRATPRGSASNLLSYNFMQTPKWRFLQHLSLADNSLTHLSAASLAPVASTLRTLDLSSNLFATVPDGLSGLVSLRALNLSYCMIDDLHSLTKSPLSAITTINLRGNRLSSLAGIERLLSLERVDLRENRLVDPTELARLTCIPGMAEVYVARNPFTRTHSRHRVTIFNLFRATPGFFAADVLVDGTPPSYSERKSLVDRAPEPAPVPIVKPQPMAPPPPPQPVRDFEPPPRLHDPFSLRQDDLSGSWQQKRSRAGGSGRRKKIVRRRVVEIVQEDVPPAAAPIPALDLQQQPVPPQRAEFVFPAVVWPAASAAPPRVEALDASPLSELPHPPLDDPMPDVDMAPARPATPPPAFIAAAMPSGRTLHPAPELAPAPPLPEKPPPVSKLLPARPALAPLQTAPSTVPLASHAPTQSSRAVTLTLLPAPQLSPPSQPQDGAAPPLPSEGELYKARIEALRQDFGSSWLSALAADEGWDAAAVAAAAAAASTPFDAVVGHRGPAAAGVVGVGTRSLG
jgi:Leucine-rich repeat (LRR) protein